MRRQRLLVLAAPALLLASVFGGSPLAASGAGSQVSATQTDAAYASSGGKVTNVFATTKKTSCYTPEAPFFTSLSPNDGYDGMSACNGVPNTGEDPGPYASQTGSNSSYPASGPMLVKDHSESDIQADPTNAQHLIGTSKWFVSAEGYNHVMGFYESFDGGATWPTQGHIPGYEGWTDNTDPVGAFDSYGNFYFLNLPYQFYYNSDGSHNFQINQNKEPNPSVSPEVISVEVRQHSGHLDYVAAYDAKGREPDKQWIAVDTNPGSPFFNRVYAMWAVFDGCCTAKTFVSYAQASPDGTHSDWSAPIRLPDGSNNSLRDGIETTFTVGRQKVAGRYPLYVAYEDYSTGFDNIQLTASYDGGLTWSAPIKVNDNMSPADEFQPGLAAAPNGTISVSFYDRRLACPAQGGEAAAAGLALDQVNPRYSGSLPPYGATNYCVNASIQLYGATLQQKGQNVRLSQHSFDPQLSSPHTSCPGCVGTFIGDYFGNTFSGTTSVTTFVSTYSQDRNNTAHYQQQVVATMTTS